MRMGLGAHFYSSIDDCRITNSHNGRCEHDEESEEANKRYKKAQLYPAAKSLVNHPPCIPNSFEIIFR